MSGSTRRYGARSAWRVTASRNFGPYFVGNALSASGTWFHNLAASVLVYQLTHSPFLLGVLNFCQFLPVLLFAAWAGRFADAYDRRSILLVTQPTAAAVSAALAVIVWTGHASVEVIFAFSICLGMLGTFSNTAQMALVGSLVDRADLPQAVALNSITFNVARAIGPLGATAVITVFDTGTAFAVNSLSFIAFAVGLLFVSTRHRAGPGSGRNRLRDGLAVVRAQRRLMGLLAVVVTVSFASDPVNTEGPALAGEFGLSPVWAGAIVGVFGTGAVLAGVTVGGRAGSARRISLALAVMGAGMVGLALAPWLALGLVLVGAAGAGYLSANAAATSGLQLGVDEFLWGRIMAIWSVGFLGVRPLASLVDGALAGMIGVRAATVVMALPAFALALAITIARRPGRRRAPTPAASP